MKIKNIDAKMALIMAILPLIAACSHYKKVEVAENICLVLPSDARSVDLGDVKAMFSDVRESNSIFKRDNYFIDGNTVWGFRRRNWSDMSSGSSKDLETSRKTLTWAVGLQYKVLKSEIIENKNGVAFSLIEFVYSPSSNRDYNEILISSEFTDNEYKLIAVVMYPSADSVQVRKEVDKMLHSVRFMD